MTASFKLRESLNKINLDPSEAYLLFDEPMAGHTTFRVGGPAELMVRPTSAEALRRILLWARDEELPSFILGGGANILVADKGIRGLVIDMGGLNSADFQPKPDGSVTMTVQAGLDVSSASALAADQDLAGLDFIYSMPGSVGGAVYMNARCYGSEIGDILESVEYLDDQLIVRTLIPERSSFKYKDTPFQNQSWIITAASLRLVPGEREQLWQRMQSLEADRRAKGHFIAPCAGSVFKNNHAFGEPSGKIIDSLQLRGFGIGGAKISDGHANIIINTGTASAQDIKALIDHIHERVLLELGFDLEPEVLLVGEW